MSEVMLRKSALASAANVDVEDISDDEVRTTLHRLAQTLKIHRNEMFAGDPSLQPPSIILTHLAALSYSGGNLIDELANAADRLPTLITKTSSGMWVLENPTQPKENFADRWTDEHQAKFLTWIGKLRRDIDDLDRVPAGLQHMVARLGESFGLDTITKAATRNGHGHHCCGRRGARRGYFQRSRDHRPSDEGQPTDRAPSASISRRPRSRALTMAVDPVLKPLTVWEQAFGIVSRWPGTVRIVQIPAKDGGLSDELRWTGEFTPTKLGCTYSVQFVYKVGDPIVWVQVIDPVLDPGAGMQLPHVYGDSTQCWLCLHLDDQWTRRCPSQRLSFHGQPSGSTTTNFGSRRASGLGQANATDGTYVRSTGVGCDTAPNEMHRSSRARVVG